MPKADRGMIVVFGSINVDLVCRVPSIARPGETVLARGYETLHGGKGANQAVAAARAGGGLPVFMCGRVGEDGFGHAARANLVQERIDVGGVLAGPDPTGCAFIAVDPEGENAITVASGANAALRASDLTRAFEDGDVLVLQMEVPFVEGLSVARHARAGGARVVWNLAPASPDLDRAACLSLIGATDVLIVNEHEARAAAALTGPENEDAEKAAAALSAAGADVVLTRGARGAVLARAGSIVAEARAAAVQVVDTTGAGDTFVGTLATCIAEGRDLFDGLARSCLAASLACRASGAQPGMPTRIELDRRQRGSR
jgi:ribokinase